MNNRKIFTSESVTQGHPDKLCDLVSDSVLDAVLEQDPMGRVACETAATTGMVLVMGEISTECYVDIPHVARQILCDIGYDGAAAGFDGKTCVHPRQIDTVNACFTPSEKEIRNAKRVLEALEEAARNHTGVCVLDGGMVDKPMELRARTTLAKAAAAGIKVGGVKK